MGSGPVQIEMFPTAVHLTRIEPAENGYRYYSLAITADLFGGFALARTWGRIGQSCTVRIELYETESAAIDALQGWRDRKRQRGYIQSNPLRDRLRRVDHPDCRDYSGISS